MLPRRIRHEDDSAWKDAAPHRAAFKACVLVDDLVHKGVSKASERLEDRLGKRKQAYLATVAGVSVSTVILHGEPDPAKAMAIGFTNLAAILASMAVFEGLARRQASSEGAAAVDRTGMLAKAVRLPMLVASAVSLACGYMDGASVPLAFGSVWGAYSIGLYIMSSSTGMIDRIKEWAAGLYAGKQMAPVPAKIKD